MANKSFITNIIIHTVLFLHINSTSGTLLLRIQQYLAQTNKYNFMIDVARMRENSATYMYIQISTI